MFQCKNCLPRSHQGYWISKPFFINPHSLDPNEARNRLPLLQVAYTPCPASTEPSVSFLFQKKLSRDPLIFASSLWSALTNPQGPRKCIWHPVISEHSGTCWTLSFWLHCGASATLGFNTLLTESPKSSESTSTLRCLGASQYASSLSTQPKFSKLAQKKTHGVCLSWVTCHL